jgi:hypothetical protein
MIVGRLRTEPYKHKYAGGGGRHGRGRLSNFRMDRVFFGRIECLFLTFFNEGIRLQVMEALLARAHLARSDFITGIDGQFGFLKPGSNEKELVD